jgi:hypothetical protein
MVVVRKKESGVFANQLLTKRKDAGPNNLGRQGAPAKREHRKSIYHAQKLYGWQGNQSKCSAPSETAARAKQKTVLEGAQTRRLPRLWKIIKAWR